MVIGQMTEPSQLIQNLMVCGPVTGIILQDAIPHIRTVKEYSDDTNEDNNAIVSIASLLNITYGGGLLDTTHPRPTFRKTKNKHTWLPGVNAQVLCHCLYCVSIDGELWVLCTWGGDSTDQSRTTANANVSVTGRQEYGKHLYPWEGAS